jgi:serine/threonine protein phosphatase PrpC
MNYATSYDVGDRKRAGGINEDSVAITVFEQGHRDGLQDSERTADETPTNRSVAVFALADGAGGHDGGDVASYIAANTICEQLAPAAIGAARHDPSPFGLDFDTGDVSASAANLEAAIAEAIVTAHREIISYAADSGIGAYTTVVAGLCLGGRLHYGWVGDSRAYVVNEAREQITRLTKDHSVVEELRDAGEIDEIEAHVHPKGNEITRALGGQGHDDPEHATVEVETETVDLFAEDIVFVTSDGIIDAQTDAPTLYDTYLESDRSETVAETIRERVVTDDKLREWILSADSLDEASETLIERANERGGKDNLSTILFTDPALPETPADGGLPIRARDTTGVIADRETVILSDE